MGATGGSEDNDKEAVSEVEILPGLGEHEELRGISTVTDRRFARLPVSRTLPLSRPRRRAEGAQASVITEGSQRSVNLREGLYRRTLALADGLAAVLALMLVIAWDAGTGVQPWVLMAIPVAIIVNKVGGLYERDELVMKKTTLDEIPALLQISGLYALIVFLGENQFVHTSMTPPLVLELWIATFLALIAGRTAARELVSRLVSPERCVVLGDAESIDVVRTKLSAAGLNTEIVGAVRLDPLAPRVDMSRLAEVVEDLGVHRVILAPVTNDAGDTLDLIRTAKSIGVRVSLLPRIFEVVGSAVEFDHVDGLTMLGVRRFGLTRSSLALKRAFDLAGATIMLVAVAPIMGAVALAVRLDSPGPVLFRQTRVGRDGARFEIFKFRTMVPDAEQLKTTLLHLNETQGLFKITNDPRITRIGAFLRKTALDELPQLLNVWRGEMSLVGPRPLVVDEDAQVRGLDRSRLHLTPGMTGHWQILGSGRIPLKEMVGIDYLYVANWSLWTDLKILLRTLPYILARRGM
jgi:exopolysaccharide biosynthesis polyprenyl glycosylphosphotransferase